MFKIKRALLLMVVLALCFTAPSFAAVVACNGVPDSSGLCPLAVDDSGYTTFNGGIYAKYEAATTNDTITAAESGKTFVVSPVSGSPVTFTLPTAVAGLNFKFIAGSGHATTTLRQFYIDPQSTDYLIVANAGTTSTYAAGDKTQSGGITGDSIELICTTDGTWIAIDTRGTWVDAN